MAQKTETKNDCKWWNLSSLVTNTLASLIWVIFSAQQSYPSLLWKNIFKKLCLGEIGDFLLSGVVMIKTWERVFLGGMCKNEQIHFLDSKIYFTVTLMSWIWNFFATMVEYTGLRKNWRNILKRLNPLGVHRIIRGCILEVNSEGSTMFV